MLALLKVVPFWRLRVVRQLNHAAERRFDDPEYVDESEPATRALLSAAVLGWTRFRAVSWHGHVLVVALCLWYWLLPAFFQRIGDPPVIAAVFGWGVSLGREGVHLFATPMWMAAVYYVAYVWPFINLLENRYDWHRPIAARVENVLDVVLMILVFIALILCTVAADGAWGVFTSIAFWFFILHFVYVAWVIRRTRDINPPTSDDFGERSFWQTA